MSNDLKMPMAGYRSQNAGNLVRLDSRGYYWSSSPYGTDGYSVYFYNFYATPSHNDARAYGFSVRCFKN